VLRIVAVGVQGSAQGIAAAAPLDFRQMPSNGSIWNVQLATIRRLNGWSSLEALSLIAALTALGSHIVRGMVV